MKKLSIVIPAKDEEKRLPASLASLCRYIDKHAQYKNDEIEIIIVANNCTDSTYRISKIFKTHFPFIRVFNIDKAIGKGGAIKYGFEKASGEHILFVDADGSSPAHEIFRLYEETTKANKLIGIANRYNKDSTIIRRLPASRVFFSRVFRLISKALFRINYQDTQCGLKVFQKDIGKYLMKLNRTAGWTFDLNLILLAKKNDIDIYNMPTIWEYKEGSSLNIRKAINTVTKELVQTFLVTYFKSSRINRTLLNEIRTSHSIDK